MYGIKKTRVNDVRKNNKVPKTPERMNQINEIYAAVFSPKEVA